MPTNKNAMTRCKVIDELLSNRQYPRTLDELTDKVNEELLRLDIEPVTRRCVEKDIQYLEYDSPWMVEIERKSVADTHPVTGKSITRRCLFYKKPGYSIFKKQLSDDEKYLLSGVLSLIGQFDGMPDFDGLDNLIRSLEIKPEKRIISIEKNPIQDSTLLGQAYNVIAKEWTINLYYHTYSAADEIKHIAFYPYLLKEYNRRWYLIGAAASDMKILSFALDRVNAIEPTPGIPFIPYPENIHERYDDILGVTYTDNAPIIPILFWVSDNSKDYVATKPLHESQRHHSKDQDYRSKYPALHGGAFFSIEVQINYELIRELCSFGSDLIVLSPKSIREKIINRLSEMNEKYKNTNNQFAPSH